MCDFRKQVGILNFSNICLKNLIVRNYLLANFTFFADLLFKNKFA